MNTTTRYKITPNWVHSGKKWTWELVKGTSVVIKEMPYINDIVVDGYEADHAYGVWVDTDCSDTSPFGVYLDTLSNAIYDNPPFLCLDEAKERVEQTVDNLLNPHPNLLAVAEKVLTEETI